ncbi:hypothetical protein LS684_12830 [Cytobacillus spongiae]|uniref:hypothetical protein n=1 Tax=Cytobacillus spongiae TaxID=2901381 RepID=UPI001F3FA9C2|nr:hypothetical protein [Cytobacillus spongiae]UII54552.1 hypothetical protein LS684_12830 [Cytobacillus spongiae]
MYRFSIEEEDWILRFSPNLQMEEAIKKAVIHSIMHLSKQLPKIPHGESFAIFNDEQGLMIFNVEKIPSLILTLAHIIPRDRWYKQQNTHLFPYVD